MCDEAASFDSKAKPAGCFVTPGRHGGFGRKAIKAVIDFDCIKVTSVPREIARAGKIGGVKIAFPMSVMPAGCADADARVYDPASIESWMSVPRPNPLARHHRKPGDGPPHLVNALDGDNYLQVGM